MRTTVEFRQKFLVDREESGRFLVKSFRTGKTYFVDTVCKLYRDFVTLPENRKFTFKFKNLDQLGGYGKITSIESQTFEDPMVLLMNLFETKAENIDFLIKNGVNEDIIYIQGYVKE